MTNCWECETATPQATTVRIPSQHGPITLLALCPGCYQQCYLPLFPSAVPPVDLSL
jgi:hypothetical protein